MSRTFGRRRSTSHETLRQKMSELISLREQVDALAGEGGHVGIEARSGSPHLARLSDVPIRQLGAYARPCGPELPFAVLKIGALSAIAAERRLAVHIAAPRPLINMSRKTEIFPDPANRQVAPDHCVVVGVALAADHGGAERDGFVVEHGARLRLGLARKPAHAPPLPNSR
jgi:hypothetical protein